MSRLLSQCKFDLLEELVTKEVKYTFNFSLKINVLFPCNQVIYTVHYPYICLKIVCVPAVKTESLYHSFWIKALNDLLLRHKKVNVTSLDYSYIECSVISYLVE